MVPGFSVTLGASLCAFGLAGILRSTGFHANTVYDALCVITGVLALMVVFERRRIVRRIWTVIAVVHATLIAMAAVGMVEASAAELMVSASATGACLIANWRAKGVGRRRLSFYRFDERLAPE